MNNDCRLAGGEQGFTLLEILISMVLLSIGLLGLQGLGIMAARSVATAEWMTTASATGSTYLEGALQELRIHESDPAVRPSSRCVDDGANRVSVAIDMTDARLPRVEVTVTPASGTPANRVVTLSSHAFYDIPLTGPASGSACP